MKNTRRDFLKALGVLGVTSSELMKLQNTLAASFGSGLAGCYVTGTPQGGNPMSGSVFGGQEIHRLFNVLSR